MFATTKKYDLSRNDTTADPSGGHYKRISASPIVKSCDTLLQISATDSHESAFIASLAFEGRIGRMANRPLHCNQSAVRVKGNGAHIYLRGIGFIPKELFESLPESKVDPDVPTELLQELTEPVPQSEPDPDRTQ